jgi:hypothetical protein
MSIVLVTVHAIYRLILYAAITYHLLKFYTAMPYVSIRYYLLISNDVLRLPRPWILQTLSGESLRRLFAEK